MLRLRGLLGVLPDNKIAEEVHHGLKRGAKKTQKSQRRTARQQSVALATPVLSTRGHPSRGPSDEGLVDPALQFHKGHTVQEQALFSQPYDATGVDQGHGA